MRKFLNNNNTIIASISYILAMCLAQCFTKTFSFEFLDNPMESELLSLLYKEGAESPEEIRELIKVIPTAGQIKETVFDSNFCVISIK